MVASAKGRNRAERACFLEKKRSDDRDDFVGKFLMKGQLPLGNRLICRAAMDSISARERAGVSSPLCAPQPDVPTRTRLTPNGHQRSAS
jgi:hypothetical protein